MDRDLVHRQTACSVVQHMSLGVAGLGCEDALTHLLNYVFPNIFEVSPHIIQVRAWAGVGGWVGGQLGWAGSQWGVPGGRVLACSDRAGGARQAVRRQSPPACAPTPAPPSRSFSPQSTTGAIDGCRVALGPAVVLNYLLQARKRGGGGGGGGAARACSLAARARAPSPPLPAHMPGTPARPASPHP